MIITDKEYGQFNVCLCDDGTLDTVILVSHGLVKTREYRYDTEYVAGFRNNNGAMTFEGFAALAEESLEAYIEDNCQ